jgi:RNA polymerase sigma factor (TIGR02999 family)
MQSIISRNRPFIIPHPGTNRGKIVVNSRELFQLERRLSGDITRLLAEAQSGNKKAESEAMALVYSELRKLARGRLRREPPGNSVQTTALVNEAYLRLSKGGKAVWKDRNHFFCVASRLMRRILIDLARNRRAVKRGGEWQREPADEARLGQDVPLDRVLAVDQALSRLALLDQRQSQIVEMRFFGGLTEEEIAEALGISSRTVKREWSIAKAWLYSELM